jgi:hypothetical protein
VWLKDLQVGKVSKPLGAAASADTISVIMRLKRDPCVTGTQGDCRGGNKTVFSVLKGV